MGMRPPRICRHAGCQQLTTVGSGSPYCARHQNAPAIADALRKVADKWWKFYNCKLWKVFTREAVIIRDGGMCTTRDDAGARCPRIGVHVHHGIEPDIWVTVMGRDFYDLDNLTLLCASCHSKITARTHGWDN